MRRLHTDIIYTECTYHPSYRLILKSPPGRGIFGFFNAHKPVYYYKHFLVKSNTPIHNMYEVYLICVCGLEYTLAARVKRIYSVKHYKYYKLEYRVHLVSIRPVSPAITFYDGLLSHNSVCYTMQEVVLFWNQFSCLLSIIIIVGMYIICRFYTSTV